MRLFIAEKPNLAEKIAGGLPGPHTKKNGYIETGGGIVTWLFGHVLRQAEPAEYSEQYKTWRIDDLPIVPNPWKLIVLDSKKNQTKIVKDLLKQATEIIHAGDPDREGQLLVDEVLEYFNNKKPVKRVLFSAQDSKSIQRGLENICSNEEPRFQGMCRAALGRSRADWIVGMNLTRAFTIAARRAGHTGVFPVGRVKTPTLALVVRREREIQAFKPIDYMLIKAQFKHHNSEFTAAWRPKDTQIGLDSEGRLINEQVAEELLNRFAQAQATMQAKVTIYETTDKQEHQPLPFSLSDLQILAGKKYGYSASEVLAGAQSLYEKQFTTYPRSDCNFLPTSQYEDQEIILANLKSMAGSELSAWASRADPTIKSKAWNDSKITAHHAIIPTCEPCKIETLPEKERNLYFLIAQAYIAQFWPIHQYKQTKVELTYTDELFTTSGRTITLLGWKELYKNDVKKQSDEEATLIPLMKPDDHVEYITSSITKKKTKPPERFTNDTLIEAMKNIHKYLKDETLKTRIKSMKGIGTEATRATIIDDLAKAYLSIDKKRFFYPTDGAYALIDALPDEITYPDTTALWDEELEQLEKLEQVSKGNIELDNFITKQIVTITDLCKNTGNIKAAENAQQCPQCKKGTLALRKGKYGPFWSCTNYPECKAAYKDKKGKPELTPEEAIPCPQCGQGVLRKRKGTKGAFWGCSKYPDCKATYEDKKGKPDLTGQKKKKGK